MEYLMMKSLQVNIYTQILKNALRLKKISYKNKMRSGFGSGESSIETCFNS